MGMMRIHTATMGRPAVRRDAPISGAHLAPDGAVRRIVRPEAGQAAEHGQRHAREEKDSSTDETRREDSMTALPRLQTPDRRLQRTPDRPSTLVPDLDADTVSNLESLMPVARADHLRQEMVDAIVSDRRRKGVDFSIMVQGRPLYDSTLWQRAMQQLPAAQRGEPRNGITVHPRSSLNPEPLPLVLIGPSALGPLIDPSNRDLIRELVVRLYTAITHEYRHATQWQRPAEATAMGRVRLEVDAFFADIENSRATGLAGQREPFRHTWDEAVGWWRQLQEPASWGALSDDERSAYAARCRRVFAVVQSVLGRGVSSPCGP